MALWRVLQRPNLCGSGDLSPTAVFLQKPSQVEIFAATAVTRARVGEMAARVKLKNHRSPADFAVNRILATRELRRQPGYKPKFVNYPLAFTSVEVELTSAEVAQLRRLRFADYQKDDEILREAVMRWLFRNRTRRGKLKHAAAGK